MTMYQSLSQERKEKMDKIDKHERASRLFWKLFRNRHEEGLTVEEVIDEIYNLCFNK